MFKHIPHQIQTCPKNDSRIAPQQRIYFRGGASWGTIGGPIHFSTLQTGPQRSQCASNDRRVTKTKSLEIRDEFQKSSHFGDWPCGLREVLAISTILVKRKPSNMCWCPMFPLSTSFHQISRLCDRQQPSFQGLQGAL